MVYLIFDNPNDKEKMQFLHDYPTDAYRQIYPECRLFNIPDTIRFVSKTVGFSTPEDKLVFWYDFMGILCWWICKVTFRKRNITVLNILLKDKKSRKNRIAKFLYRTVLKNDVQATVTSSEYGEWINQLLGIQRTYPVLHDVYHGNAEKSEQKVESYVFCGGKNGRDWKMLFEIAENMPFVEFLSVMPGYIYEKIKDWIPDNMTVKCDISETRFKEYIRKSALVIMPLDTQAPAGLIVMFQAGSFNKCVIASDTVTTREYINLEKGALCTDTDSWIEKIEYLLNNPVAASQKADKFNAFLNVICSEKAYAGRLYEIVGS